MDGSFSASVGADDSASDSKRLRTRDSEIESETSRRWDRWIELRWTGGENRLGRRRDGAGSGR